MSEMKSLYDVSLDIYYSIVSRTSAIETKTTSEQVQQLIYLHMHVPFCHHFESFPLQSR